MFERHSHAHQPCPGDDRHGHARLKFTGSKITQYRKDRHGPADESEWVIHGHAQSKECTEWKGQKVSTAGPDEVPVVPQKGAHGEDGGDEGGDEPWSCTPELE